MLVYRLTASDVVHAARAWSGRHWRGARYSFAALLVIVGLGWLAKGSPGWGLGFIAVGALEAGNFLPSGVLAALLRYRVDPKYRDEFRLTPTVDHLRFQNSTIDSTLSWTLYRAWFETPRLVVLQGPGVFTVIPKRAFASETAQAEFQTLLARVIGR